MEFYFREAAMTTLTMSDNGRVLIPAELRARLGFQPSTRIYAEVKNGSLVLTSGSQRAAQRRAYFDRVVRQLDLPPGTSLADELIAERRAEADREER